MDLNELLSRPDVTLADLQKHLGSLSGDARVRQATAVHRGLQKKLWNLAEKGEPLRKDDLVPSGHAPLDPIPFEGWNNQPIYRPFQKVFYRTRDNKVAGYNVSDAAWFAGPGYYIVEEGPRGTYVDYTQIPNEKPDGWPPIKRNEDGLSRFVYGFMHDYLRRVYGNILIGRAYRHGKETGNYFILARP